MTSVDLVRKVADIVAQTLVSRGIRKMPPIKCPKCGRILGFRDSNTAHLRHDVVRFDRSGKILCRENDCDGQYVFRVNTDKRRRTPREKDTHV